MIDNGGAYTGRPFPATVTITGSGTDDSPALSLAGVIPTLAYYDGAGTSGMNLGATPPTASGTYTVVARFAGTANYLGVQSAPVTFTISAGAATIALSSSTASAVYGQAITFVANVVAAATPNGTVTFFDNGTTLATVALDGSDAATLTTSALALGSHSITATYGGDAGLAGAKSGSVPESVGQSGDHGGTGAAPGLEEEEIEKRDPDRGDRTDVSRWRHPDRYGHIRAVDQKEKEDQDEGSRLSGRPRR